MEVEMCPLFRNKLFWSTPLEPFCPISEHQIQHRFKIWVLLYDLLEAYLTTQILWKRFRFTCKQYYKFGLQLNLHVVH